MKMRLAMFDLDGTLFDTRRVNFLSYQKALEKFGVKLDYDFFANFCNGRHYKSFLPKLLDGEEKIEEVHRMKKEFYSEFLGEALCNFHLIEIAKNLKPRYFCSIVTTASKKNATEILEHFGVSEIFDLLVSAEDVKNKKPNPECFLFAMKHFGITADNSLIFEDSEVGIKAAEKAGATIFIARGFA